MTPRDFPHSYADAADFLGGKYDRPLANNTRVVSRRPDRIAIRLHFTDIVTFHENGSATLTTGGWNTVTTRGRINHALGYGNAPLRQWGVGTERGVLYLYRRNSPEDYGDVTRYAWHVAGQDSYTSGHHSITIWPDGRTDATPKPKRPYVARPHAPNCRCVVHGGSWRARVHGRYLTATAPDTVSHSGDGDTSCFEKPEGVPALAWHEYNRKFNDLLRGGKS